MSVKLLKTAVLAATVLAIGSSGALAYNDGKAKLKHFDYDVKSAWTTLHVTSSDGTKWDDLKSGNLLFWAHMKVDTRWPGSVEQVGVVLGNCSGESCKSFPILWSDNTGWRDYNHQRNFSVPTSLLENGTPGLALVRQNIIATCNQHLSARGATTRHTFQGSLPTTFIADTDKRDLGKVLHQAGGGDSYPPLQEIDHSKTGSFTFNVVCEPFSRPQTADGLKMEEPDFKVKDINLFLSTFSGATTSPNPATTCKKGRILVRVKTSKAGPTKFKLWTKVGDGPMTSKVVDAWASFDGNAGYKAEYTEWVPVDKTTPVQAMAEEMNSGFGMSTAWKDITLTCKGQGGNGGLASDTDNGNPDNDIPQAKTLKGDFSFADYGAPKCPRTGKALITFTSPKSDNIHWSLDCKFSSKSGVLQTQANPAGGYMAATLVSLDVGETMDETCTLKTVAPYNPREHVTKSHLFQCVTPSVETGSNDFVPETRPAPHSTHQPATVVVVDPPRKWKGARAGAAKKRLEAIRKAREAHQKAAEAAKRRHDAAKKAAAAAQHRKALIAAKKAAAKAAEQARRKRAAALKARKLKAQQAAAARKARALARKKAAQKRRMVISRQAR
jgi:hypothetical protein